MTFPIRLDWRFRIPLLLWGVTRRSAWLRLSDDALVVRFGFFSLRSPLANVERWEMSGPYRWWRAIGVRGSLGKAEITFGGSAHGGIALFLRRPIPRWWWIRNLSVVYVTLDDVEGLAAELSRRGIGGTDVRTVRGAPTPGA